MKSLLLTLVLALFASPTLRAEDDALADTLFQKLLAAQVAKDYDAFVMDASTGLKAALSKTQFEASSDIMIPKLAAGYEIMPLGELNQRGYEVYLYRLRFKNGGDDMLGTLSLKDGKVGGIFFR
jgi:cellulose biosynthesis protein BcsQ